MQTNENNKVVLNTPISLDFAVFGAINKSKNIHKLIWLIHQINHFTYGVGTCKMHKETYYTFLGISPNDLNKYLNILQATGLITQTIVGNNIKNVLSEYVFNAPFQPNTGEQHIYKLENPKCPAFIKRWASDNFKMKSVKESSYQKPAPIKKVKVDNSLSIIKAQIDEIKCLRETIAKLELELAKSTKISQSDEVNVVDDTSTSVEIMNEPETLILNGAFGKVEIRDYKNALAIVHQNNRSADDLHYAVSNNIRGISTLPLLIKYAYDFDQNIDYATVLAS